MMQKNSLAGLHSLPLSAGTQLPVRFNNPFHYTPHPLCIEAATQVQAYLASRADWQDEFLKGKMFGVLVVRTPQGEVGFLAAFSGILAGSNLHDYFVPPVYDLLQPDGFFKIEEAEISHINELIQAMEQSVHYLKVKDELAAMQQEAEADKLRSKEELKEAKRERDRLRKEGSLSAEEESALVRESQFQKAEAKRRERQWKERIEEKTQELMPFEHQLAAWKEERKNRSAALQTRLFEQFQMLNARGEALDLCTIFARTPRLTPPAGSGECAAPKLLQYAYLHHCQPLCMAEFWWGNSPASELRHHGHYYPSCQSKCAPILAHMLQGLDVEPNPLEQPADSALEPTLVYEDEYLLIVDKPAGLLSVPGKHQQPSVYSWAVQHYPEATGPLIVHRLDMDTSGLLLLAKDKETHALLQAQFEGRTVKKRYQALLEGTPDFTSGRKMEGSENKRNAEKLEGGSKEGNKNQSVPEKGDDDKNALCIKKEKKFCVEKEKEASNFLSEKSKDEGLSRPAEGLIKLPLRPDLEERPRQLVDFEFGKPAVTRYQVLGPCTHQGKPCTRILLYPITGRTHQLRVHVAHALGLNTPMVGDPLYGQPADRLCLHADRLEFQHPHTLQWIRMESKVPF